MQSFKVLLLSYQTPDFGRRLIRAENVTFCEALLLNQLVPELRAQLGVPLTLGAIKVCLMLPRKPASTLCFELMTDGPEPDIFFLQSINSSPLFHSSLMTKVYLSDR